MRGCFFFEFKVQKWFVINHGSEIRETFKLSNFHLFNFQLPTYTNPHI